MFIASTAQAPNRGFHPVRGEMFIASMAQDLLRGSRGGTQLAKYLSRFVPPSEPRWLVRG